MNFDVAVLGKQKEANSYTWIPMKQLSKAERIPSEKYSIEWEKTKFRVNVIYFITARMKMSSVNIIREGELLHVSRRCCRQHGDITFCNTDTDNNKFYIC